MSEGHRRIGIIYQEVVGKTDPEEILQGYKKALEKYKVTFDPQLVFIDTEPKEVDRFLSLEERPTALFATNFASGFPFLHRLRQKSPELMKKLSLVVYDDHRDECGVFGIPYRVIKQPLKEMGELATRKLQELIKGNCPPIKINLHSSLISKDPRNT